MGRAVIAATAVSLLTLASHAAEDGARPRFSLWDESLPFPTRENVAVPDGATDVVVHRAGADGYDFLHDSAIVEHQGVLFAAWYNCPRGEMVGGSLIRGRRSQDGGRTWSGVEVIASDHRRQGIMYVPVAFLSHGSTLYAFVTNMKGGPDLVYDCEAFVLDQKAPAWISRGFIAGQLRARAFARRINRLAVSSQYEGVLMLEFRPGAAEPTVLWKASASTDPERQWKRFLCGRVWSLIMPVTTTAIMHPAGMAKADSEDYLGSVTKCLDPLIEYGTDRYGPNETPVLVSNWSHAGAGSKSSHAIGKPRCTERHPLRGPVHA